MFPRAARALPLTDSGPRSAPGFYLHAGLLNPASKGSSNQDSTCRLCLHVLRSQFRSYSGSRAVEPNLKGAEAKKLDRSRFPWLPGPLESSDHAYPCDMHHLLRLLRPLARRGRHPLRPHLPPAVVSDHCSGAGRSLRYGNRTVGCRASGLAAPGAQTGDEDGSRRGLTGDSRSGQRQVKAGFPQEVAAGLSTGGQS